MFIPLSVSVPVPVFVRPPAPLIRPDSVALNPLVSIVPSAVRMTSRAVVTSAARASVPPAPLKVSMPMPGPVAPREASELISRIPLLMLVPPE